MLQSHILQNKKSTIWDDDNLILFMIIKTIIRYFASFVKDFMIKFKIKWKISKFELKEVDLSMLNIHAWVLSLTLDLNEL